MDSKELDEIFIKNASFGHRSELVRNTLKGGPETVREGLTFRSSDRQRGKGGTHRLKSRVTI